MNLINYWNDTTKDNIQKKNKLKTKSKSKK